MQNRGIVSIPKENISRFTRFNTILAFLASLAPLAINGAILLSMYAMS